MSFKNGPQCSMHTCFNYPGVENKKNYALLGTFQGLLMSTKGERQHKPRWLAVGFS